MNRCRRTVRLATVHHRVMPVRRYKSQDGVQGDSCTGNGFIESDKLLVCRQDDETDYDYDYD